MTDDNVHHGAFGSPDDDLIDDEQAAARFDTEHFDDVTAALAGVPHLAPASLDPPAAVAEAMPDWAWDRLSHALGAEAAARAAASHDNVTVLPTTHAAGAHRAPRSRSATWGGGLVAAGVAVLAVGFGVSALQGAATSSIVAGEAASAFQAAPGPLNLPGVPGGLGTSPRVAPAQAAPLPASPSADVAMKAAAVPSPLDAAPSAEGFSAAAGDPAPAAAPVVEPAALLVTDTRTAYDKDQLTEQVTTLLDDMGVESAADAEQLPPMAMYRLPDEAGFTSNWQSLRDCITWLTEEPDVQAIVVDRGTYEGSEAGVVVAPADEANASTPPPTTSITTDTGDLDVWVVTPECPHASQGVMAHQPLDLAP